MAKKKEDVLSSEEFLNEVLQDVVALGTDHSNDPPAPQSIEEAKQAILQHFQQEQEREPEITKLHDKLDELVDMYGEVTIMSQKDWDRNLSNNYVLRSEVDRLIREAKTDTLKEAAYVLKKADIDSVDIENKMYLNYVDTIEYLFAYAKQQEGSK